MAERPLCTTEQCTEHYACRLRSKGMQVSPRAQMSRTQNWRPTIAVPPAANKELIYDVRPDGSKMPILKADGEHLRGKEYRENKAQIDSTIRRIRSSGDTT